MKKLYFASAILALAATSQAQATWLLSEYKKVTKDSLETATFYGAQPFLNQASAGVVTVPEPGYIQFKATTIASDPATAPKGSGYSANVGLLHPLTSDWAERDLSGFTGLSFEYRNSDEITEFLEVAFGSSSYNQANADSGQIYSVPVADNLLPGTEWKKVSILKSEFATPGWWKKPATFPKFDSVLKRVKNLQIAPKTTYSTTGSGVQIKEGGVSTPCTGCTGPTMTKQTLEVRNIVLQGVEKWPAINPLDSGCADLPILIDNFADGNTSPAFKGGSFWYSYTDTGKADTTKAKGSSTATQTILSAAEVGATSGLFTLDAKLNKKSTDGLWQDYAGWAAAGMNWRYDDTANLTGVKGFQFKLGDLGTGNTKLVETVIFKVGIAGIKDANVYQVNLPYSALGTSGKSFCIRPKDLKQPSYLKPEERSPLDLSKVTKLSWELKITNNNDPEIDTATASVWLTDVSIYGLDKVCLNNSEECFEPGGSGVKGRPSINFNTSYKNGTLSLSGYKNVDAFEVVALDGSKVSTFAPVASKQLDLSRGTYFLVAKRGSISTAKQFVVTDR